MASRIHIYQSIQVILSVPLEFIPIAVPDPQIGSLLFFIGTPHTLFDCVDYMLWHGLLSLLAVSEDAPSFQTDFFVYLIEFTCWY